MPTDKLLAKEQEESFLTTDQENDLLIHPEIEQDKPAVKTLQPLLSVPYVRVLNGGDPSDCPYDRYMMNKRMAVLEYSKDKKGGQVIALKVLLRSCPQCERLYIDQPQLMGLKKVGLDIGGFDIIGSSAFPRTKGYEKWHPEALKKAAAVVITTEKKPKTTRKKAVKKTVEDEK